MYDSFVQQIDGNSLKILTFVLVFLSIFMKSSNVQCINKSFFDLYLYDKTPDSSYLGIGLIRLSS